jgi:hypothetical protein
MTVSLICAYRRFDPQEEMKIHTSYPSDQDMIGFPVYLSVEGRNTKAYALFGCENWQVLTTEEQLNELQNNVAKLYLSLPFKEVENDEE